MTSGTAAFLGLSRLRYTGFVAACWGDHGEEWSQPSSRQGVRTPESPSDFKNASPQGPFGAHHRASGSSILTREVDPDVGI
jgi:hypothetical protein